MADDKTKRGSPDNKRLNKSEPYELAYARKKAKAARGATGTATKRAGAAGKRAGAAKKAASRNGSARAPAARGTRKPAAAKASVRGTPHPPTGEKTGENTAPRTMKTADAVDLLTEALRVADELGLSRTRARVLALESRTPARLRDRPAGQGLHPQTST